MKQKIAFIASFPQSLLNFRLALMQQFLTRGFSVLAIAPEDKEIAEKLAALNIQYISIPMKRNGLNPFSDMALLFKLRQVLRREKPDLLFAYTIKPVIYGAFAAKLAGVNRIYSMITGTGYVFLDIDFKSRVVGLIARHLFKAALAFNQLVFFQNKDNLDFFRQKKIISSNKPATVINGSGVDCQHFCPASYPEQTVFLMIARLLYDKGTREYVQAATLIRKKYPQVKFKLVGWVDTNPNSITQDELDKWVNEKNIEYLGKLSDVRSAIAGSSIYVLPSYHEGTPRTVLEAMAMSRPIITTDAPGCRETVIRDKNGLLIPVKDVMALYRAMEYFILSPEKIPTMGEQSRKLALDKYDVHKVNRSIIDAMQLS